MIGAARRAARRRQRESVWRAAGALLLALVVLFGLLASPFVYAVERFDRPSDRLEAVPISAHACPAVRRIESATQRFEDAFSAAEVSTGPWSMSQFRLEDALTGMDRALRRGIPVVPPPVQSRFAAVLANVRRGELDVRSYSNFSEVVVNGYVEVNAAHAVYGDAAKLIGNACGSLYVGSGGPAVASSSQVAAMFAGIAKWVCGPKHDRCPPPTTAKPRG